MDIESLVNSLNEAPIPEHLKEGLLEYVVRGRPVGGFLEAVLSNDLEMSIARADMWSAESIPQIVKWLYNKAPMGCHGSSERFLSWLREGGLKGLTEGENE